MTDHRLYVFARLGLTDRSKFIYGYLIRHHRLSRRYVLGSPCRTVGMMPGTFFFDLCRP